MSRTRGGLISNEGLKLYHGTSVIAFLKDDIGWIAADSKVTFESKGNFVDYHRDRKIRETRDIFYAFTVHPIVHFNNQLIYNAFELMNETINRERDFKKSFDAFDASIIEKLNECVQVLEKNSEWEMLQKYTQTSFLGFLMVHYQGEKPLFELKSYRFELQSRGYIVKVDPPSIIQGAISMLFLGSSNAAMEYLRLNPRFLVGFSEMKEKLMFLIAQEVKANPKYVGFPIDVVEITNSNTIWCLDNMKCPIQYNCK